MITTTFALPLRWAIVLFGFFFLKALAASEVSYTYDNGGRLVQVAYPQGSGILYSYDDRDNLTGMETISLPVAPDALIVRRLQPGTAQIQWQLRGGVSGYRIYRRSNANRVWEELTDLPPNTATFLDTGLDPEETFVYQLFAIGPGSRLSAGSPISSAIQGDLAVMDPRLQFASSAADRLELRFSSIEGAAYRLEASTGLTGSDWQAQAFSFAPTGNASPESVSGTGGEMTFFIPYAANRPTRFYRVLQFVE